MAETEESSELTDDLTFHLDAPSEHSTFLVPTTMNSEESYNKFNHIRVDSLQDDDAIRQLTKQDYTKVKGDIHYLFPEQPGKEIIDYAPSEYSTYEKELIRLLNIGTKIPLADSFNRSKKMLMFAISIFVLSAMFLFSQRYVR